MAGKNGYTVEQVINAIKGSGGIKTTIAANLGGADYKTVRKYIEKYPTVNDAYNAELERNLDRAEAVVNKNIDNALKVAKAGGMADSGDAKWLLSRLGKHRGYSDKQEIEHKGGIEINKGYVIWSPDDWDNDKPKPDSDL